MSDEGQKAAIITGGSQGIGASLATAYRRRGWSVAATTRAMKPAKDPDVLTVDGDLADPADRIISGELGHCGCIEAPVNNADVYISKRAIHRAVIPAAPQNLQIWAVATTSESTDHMDTESAFGALPACDIRTRLSLSVTIAERARSHGSGPYQVDAHGSVVGGRDSTAVAVLTIGGGRAHGERCVTTRQSPARTPRR